ncbi:PREDICTED: putative UDP-glucuronate:xylan alpha-glucuronosyltransferase 5 [Nicotiana attenuata]|uniref:Hexosyltransferase n=1 Tax=Nicotiana attenuata TaxID=49451 RepID=A0A314KUZ0_NICAT|nr:PREDICTED: putative UDP-glucuronate:xylan alpha-glucuronosyltransferase 5 [Nicotiana attenuata]OIT33188.1 putative udp-glucuronate:xylan alpha-glucuronosyltransferase 5 [Nicotiana attenuata]
MASSNKPKSFTFSLIFLSLFLLYLILTCRLRPKHRELPISVLEKPPTLFRQNNLPVQYVTRQPKWFRLLQDEIKDKTLKVGLVNFNDVSFFDYVGLHGAENVETFDVKFPRVSDKITWKDLFPEWIDEDEVSAKPMCPEIPMPVFEEYEELDVVIAKVPCKKAGFGFRDVFRLQVNLVVANLLVRSGGSWNNKNKVRPLYAVFIGDCGPMWEIFRCEDMLLHEENLWVYKPELKRLKQKILMPVGSCQLAHPSFAEQASTLAKTTNKPREAYVAVLHSSEAYVCGAIALAQSIIQTNSTKDLVLLADDSISPKSLLGLRSAGWKIKKIKRIRSPHAEKNAYNEWNYSKLRIWQLSEYDKVIFIDSDFVVFRNIDQFFSYPELSAAGNDGYIFNSGVMIIEPSKCKFQNLMNKRFEVGSYNGGDQGFLNEMFVWWHRWPSKLNTLKIFGNSSHRDLSDDSYTVHYLGLKPWMCYEDYDCNWDKVESQIFASDSAHERWWKVYKKMPIELRQYCALTPEMNARIIKWRERAKKAKFSNGHWRIQVKDPRRLSY